MPFEAKVNPQSLLDNLRDLYGPKITAADIKAYCAQHDVTYQTVTKYLLPYKKGIGKWNLTVTQQLEKNYEAPAAQPAIEQNLIPEKDDSFVKFGNFGDLKKIIQSRLFYPAFITGLSGNGKTLSVEQACAQLGRELIRVNITIETDEDDLIGKWVAPTDGFTVIATANTKGKGSDDGRFIGTNVLNEAFLERFPVTFEQSYPSPATEQKILSSLIEDTEFCKRLVDWADIIRKTFYDGGVDEVISTRRLVHIARAYAIWKDKQKAIQVCLNRFDEETKSAFMDLYDKVDGDVDFKVEPTITGQTDTTVVE